jgi:hypothetical protein
VKGQFGTFRRGQSEWRGARSGRNDDVAQSEVNPLVEERRRERSLRFTQARYAT